MLLPPLATFLIYSTTIQIYLCEELIAVNEYLANGLLTVFEDGDTFFIGSKNRIVAVSTETFRIKTVASLNATAKATAECSMKGFRDVNFIIFAEKCQNHITVIMRHGDDCLYVCGTNALSPLCQMRRKKSLSQECGPNFSGIGLSAFREECPAFRISYANYTFTAVSVDIGCRKSTLLRAMPQSKRLWLPVNDDRWFREPIFVAIFVWKKFVCTAFNEATNHEMIEGRIGCVCADGPSADSTSVPYKKTFTSFNKLSVACSLDANLQLKTLKLAQISSNFLFVIFWNAFEQLPISAVCIFDLNKIEGLFNDERDPEMAWRIKGGICPDSDPTGFPRVLDKSRIVAKPQAYYVLPEVVEIVSMDAACAGNGDFQIIAVSKSAKIFGLIFSGAVITPKWVEQIAADGIIRELRFRRKTFTVLSSNSFKEYNLKDLSSEDGENIRRSNVSKTGCEWTEWSGCSRRCAGGFRQRRCLRDTYWDSFAEEQQQCQLCSDEPCAEVRRYSAWGPWLALSESAEIRYRASCGVQISDPASINSILHGSKRVKPREWLPWSEWTACSTSCGNGLRSRWRTAKGIIGSYEDSVQYVAEPCAIPPCIFGDLLEWIDEQNVRWRIAKCSEMDACFYSLASIDGSCGISATSLLLTHSTMFLLGITLSKLQQILQTNKNL